MNQNKNIPSGFQQYFKKRRLTNAEPSKCGGLVLAEINNLPDDVIDIFKAIIDKILKDKKTLIEYGY